MSRSLRLASAGLVAAAVLAITACGSATSTGGVAGATGTPGTSPASSPAASASAEASAAASAGASGALNQAFLQFQEANSSGITGGAILTDLGNNQTAVTIGVVAAGMTDPLPASLTPGDCSTLSSGGGAGASPAASAAASAAAASPAASPEASGSAVPLEPGSVIKLGDLAAGSSNTVVNIGLDGLLSQPYAVLILKSAADTTVIACADVKK